MEEKSNADSLETGSELVTSVNSSETRQEGRSLLRASTGKVSGHNWHKQHRLQASGKVGNMAGAQRFPLGLGDIVFAIPSHKSTEAQLKAGRSMRKGMRTFVVTNYTEGSGNVYPAIETWAYYPDAEPVRSFYPGDQRAALAPFLAHRELGDSFKWLLYGDDDTVFFPDAALSLASTLDPALPYVVTDNIWWSPLFGDAYHPNPQAPRCLPCHYKSNVTNVTGIKMTPGCPCTPEAICKDPHGYNGTFRQSCGVPRSPARTYSMHGGAGALISIGLLQRVSWANISRCVESQWSSGGDAFFTICLWELGFAHTTPDPLWHPSGLQMFDPSPPPLNPDDHIIPKASHILGNLLQQAAGVCEDLCELEVANTVTLHLRARRTGKSAEGAAMFVRTFSRTISRLAGHLRPTTAKELQDCSSPKMAKLAATIDNSLDIAVEAVKRLSNDFKVIRREALQQSMAATFDLVTKFGRNSISNAARSGLADSIARDVLLHVKEVALLLSLEAEEEVKDNAKDPAS